MFSILYGTYFSFQMHFKMSAFFFLNLDQPKILSSGNGLTLPNDKIVSQFKLEPLSDDKINVNQKLKLSFGRVKNIVGKKEKMLVSDIFSFSHNVFFFSSGASKIAIVL